ncbi:MAG: competence protein ComFC [Candidatus Dependentiae bacterium]|nr:competence protein ComFC [Candidatus Dependentiae bacterium]
MLGRLYKKLTEFLYPSFCVACKILLSHHQVLCGPCYAALPHVPSLHTKTATIPFLTIYAIGPYQGIVAQLAQAKEWHDIQSARQLGRLAALYCVQKHLSYDFIIPVPLHWSRHLVRGYNQAAVMAESIAMATEGRVVQPFARTRATKKQRSLEGIARKRNVAHAFGVKWYWSFEQVCALLEGKRVLLVDDVYTTGHTLKEFARLVVECKPARLDALVACRVV